jgi:hypothetical protein
VKVALEFDSQRITSCYKVFQNDIHHMFVEDLHVPERINVQLQTLQFDATLIGNIFDADGCEVRKVGERADGSEFRYFEVNSDLSARELIGKGVEGKEIHFSARRRTNV